MYSEAQAGMIRQFVSVYRRSTDTRTRTHVLLNRHFINTLRTPTFFSPQRVICYASAI